MGALINTNQRMTPLIHSVTTVNSKAIIYDKGLVEGEPSVLRIGGNSSNIPLMFEMSAVNEVRPQLSDKKVEYHYFGDGNTPVGAAHMSREMKSLPDSFTPIRSNFTGTFTQYSERSIISYRTDRLFYIYTSGTTGLPKAAVIKHARYLLVGTGIHNIMAMTDKDVVYTCLPLYHFAGGVMGSSQAVLYGNTMAIREKFSVSNYWEECIKYKATVG